MNRRSLGSSGLQVSTVGLGCNNFGGRIGLDATRKVVHKALDLGITLFDTADIYGENGASEDFLGQILGDRRKDIVLATKFGMEFGATGVMQGASRRYIMSAVEDSLRRLKTDWIDLYQLHTPDPLTPIAETLSSLDNLVRQGKVRYIGCSNLPAWQVVEAQWIARQQGLEGFISCQDEYSLLQRGLERELQPAMQSYGLGLLPFFPLASGQIQARCHATRGHAFRHDAATRRSLRHRCKLDHRGEPRGFLCQARPWPSGARLLLAAGPSAGCQCHCRRHQARTVGAERQGGRLGPGAR
jgi:aryl-alcohol dehydrogenase-like predicted oxidoreductase